LADDLGSERVEKAIADAVSKRRINETKALVLDPALDARDVRLLTDEELNISPAGFAATDKPFPREPTAALSSKVVDAAKPSVHYRYWVPLSESPRRSAPRELGVDPSLPIPKITIDLSKPLFPTAKVPRQKSPEGYDALYYFEFDTEPSFDSPNLWRYPTLGAGIQPLTTDWDANLENLTGRSGLSFNVLGTTQRGVTGHENEVKFPFRSTAMRLPANWSELSFEELERHALALGYGLSSQEMIGEMYRYGRQIYSWGSDTISRSPIDVFRAGLGECLAVNNLIGAMLEMNGLRYRVVSGFNPKFRIIMPNGGHSVIEVLDPKTGKWSYVDSFTDLMLPGVSVEELARGDNPASKLPVSYIVYPHNRAIFGDWFTLGQLFKYRSYGDSLTRLPMTSALNLRAGRGERSYGMSWSLNVAAPRAASELFPQKQTIYARARYVFAGNRKIETLGDVSKPLTAADKVAASHWAVTSFEIAPRALMAAYPEPKPPKQINPCVEQVVTSEPLTGPFKQENGYAFFAPFPVSGSGDSLQQPRRSSATVCEDDKPLGPAHSIHDDIRTQGMGRFSYWGRDLYFSTSDNSDPNTNGRSYKVVQ
jgi:hypothetical protein